MMIQPGDKLLSITDTCKKLGIGKTMLYILVTEKKLLSVVKIGNRTLVAESEADRFIANLTILDGSDCDAALMRETASSGVRELVETPIMRQVREASAGAVLVVIDNASDAYDGDENQRRHVRSFIRKLAEIARASHSALLLPAHIDKNAAKFGAAGNSYSGSTAWHNSCRSRIAIVECGGGLQLIHEKANLGRKIDPIPLRFDDQGVLVPCRLAESHPTDDTLLAFLSQAVTRGEIVSSARTGPANTFALCRTLTGFPATLSYADAFWSALSRLSESGAIVRETYRNENRKAKEKWVLAPVAPVRSSSGISATGALGGDPAPLQFTGGVGVERRTETGAAANLSDEASLAGTGAVWEGET